MEVPAFTSSLNSNDVFLLRTQAEHYLWYGKVGWLAQWSYQPLRAQRCTNPPVSKGKGTKEWAGAVLKKRSLFLKDLQRD